jgi:hypothetical protein
LRQNNLDSFVIILCWHGFASRASAKKDKKSKNVCVFQIFVVLLRLKSTHIGLLAGFSRWTEGASPLFGYL